MSGEPEEKEWRKSNRYDCMGEAEVILSPAKPALAASVLNLSMGGCLVALDKPVQLELDEAVEVLFNVNHTMLRLFGTVRSIRSEYEFGVQFLVGSRLVRWQLEELTQELAAALRKRILLARAG